MDLQAWAKGLSLWKPGTSLRPPQGQPQASSTSTQVEAMHTCPREGTWVPGKAVALTAVLPPSCLCVRTPSVPRMQRRSGWQKGTPFLKHCPGLPVALCWAVCTHVRSVSCSHSAFLSTFRAGSQALGIAWLLAVGNECPKSASFPSCVKTEAPEGQCFVPLSEGVEWRGQEAEVWGQTGAARHRTPERWLGGEQDWGPSLARATRTAGPLQAGPWVTQGQPRPWRRRSSRSIQKLRS